MQNSRQFLTEVGRVTECLEHNGITTVTLPSNFKIEKTEDIDCMTVTDKFMAKIIDSRNKEIIRTVIEWAKSNGFTQIELIDERFLESAFKAEFARRKGIEQTDFDRGYLVGYSEGFVAGLQNKNNKGDEQK